MIVHIVMVNAEASDLGTYPLRGFLDKGLAEELSNRVNESAQSRGDGSTSWVCTLPIEDAPLPSQGRPES